MQSHDNTPDRLAQAAPEDTRRGETYNYQPAKRQRLEYLSAVAKLQSEPRDQESLVLFRVASGKGGPVPLPEIQQSAGGKFVAQLCARLHSLRFRYGFVIRNKTDRASTPIRSWYWIELNADGSPRMTAVPVVEGKTGKPKSKASGVTQAQPATKKTARSQTGWRAPGQQLVINDKFSPVRIAPPSQDDLFGRNGPRAAHWSDPDTQPRRAGGAR